MEACSHRRIWFLLLTEMWLTQMMEWRMNQYRKCSLAKPCVWPRETTINKVPLCFSPPLAHSLLLYLSVSFKYTDTYMHIWHLSGLRSSPTYPNHFTSLKFIINCIKITWAKSPQKATYIKQSHWREPRACIDMWDIWESKVKINTVCIWIM